MLLFSFLLKVCIDNNFILPFVFRPKGSEIFNLDLFRIDKIYQIDLNFVGDEISLWDTSCIFKVDTGKDDTSFRRNQLKSCIYGSRLMSSKGNLLRSINDSQITLSREFDRNVLQGFVGSVDEQHFEVDIIFVNFNNSFSVNGIL